MTPAVLLAAAAAAAGVLAAWDLLGLLGRAPAAVRAVLAPVDRAGRAGLEPSGTERRRLAALLAAALVAAGWLVAGPVAGLGLGAAGPLAGRSLVAARTRRWRAALLDEAPTLARAVADALAGGHSVRGALVEAGARGGLTGPARDELRAAAHALALGAPTDTVLEALRVRAGAPAYDTLVAAVLLQRDAGGDLARLLRDLAASLEAAVRLARDARAATAQARFTATLVAGLPFAALVLAELAQPGSLAGLLAFPPSAALVAAAVALQLVGVVVVRRCARVGEAP